MNSGHLIRTQINNNPAQSFPMNRSGFDYAKWGIPWIGEKSGENEEKIHGKSFECCGKRQKLDGKWKIILLIRTHVWGRALLRIYVEHRMRNNDNGRYDTTNGNLKGLK